MENMGLARQMNSVDFEETLSITFVSINIFVERKNENTNF